MAAPSLTSGTPGEQGTLSSSHTVLLPAGTSDKLIVIVTFAGSAHTVSATDWTVVKQLAQSAGRWITVLRRLATSETSVSVATSQTTYAAWCGFSTDGDLANMVFSTGLEGQTGTNTPDVDGLTGLTLGDYRVLAFYGQVDGRRTVTAYPTNYADNNHNPGVNANSRPRLGVASRGLTGITAEDPGIFTTTGSIGVWAGGSLAIPAAGAPTFSGSIAVTQAADTMDADGLTTPPAGGGVIIATQGSDGMVASGTHTPPTFSGSITATQADDTMVAGNAQYPGGLPAAAVIALYDARTLSGSPSDPVASWPDLGPLSQNALAQATSGFRPVISDSGFGGVRSVQFDGTDDRLDVTLDQTYTGDFAMLVLVEYLTYPTNTAGMVFSTGGGTNKNILGIDDVEDPPGWVVMSGDGTQADHHHGTANQAYLEAVPSRFVMVELIRNAGPLKLWERKDLVIDLADASASQANLNDMPGLKVGARENDTRFGHIRVGLVLLVNMAETDETTLLAARDQLGEEFNVPGFVTHSGSLAADQGSDSMAAAGATSPPVFSGAVAATQAPDTMAAAGSTGIPGATGAIAATQGADGMSAAGSHTPPVYTGGISAAQEGQSGVAAGLSSPPVFSGSLGGQDGADTMAAAGSHTPPVGGGNLVTTQGPDTMVAAGAYTPPGRSGSIAVAQAADTMAAAGTHDSPVRSGVLSATAAGDGMVAQGSHVSPRFVGSLAAAQQGDSMAAAGTFGIAVRSGVIAATQEGDTMETIFGLGPIDWEPAPVGWTPAADWWVPDPVVVE